MPHSDRRQKERIVPWTKAHVTVMAGGDMLPARVSNISVGGVAVIYENSQIPCCNTMVSIDILASSGANLIVTGLHCRTVYDQLTLSENSSYKGNPSRRCGLEFITPSNHQKHQLSRLLAGIR